MKRLVFLTLLAATACVQVQPKTDRPPPSSGDGVNVDPSNVISIDKTKVVEVKACPPGQIVASASGGWTCINVPACKANEYLRVTVDGWTCAEPANGTPDPARTPVMEVGQCANGNIVQKVPNGWACVPPTPPLAEGIGIHVVDGKISANLGTERGTVSEGNHNHDDKYLKITDKIAWTSLDQQTVPAAPTWASIKSSVTTGDVWIGATDWSQVRNRPPYYQTTWSEVSGITASTVWAGTVSTGQVTSPGGLPSAEERIAALEATVKSMKNAATLTDLYELDTFGAQSCDDVCENKSDLNAAHPSHGTCVGAQTKGEAIPGIVPASWHPCSKVSSSTGAPGNLACYCAAWHVQ